MLRRIDGDTSEHIAGAFERIPLDKRIGDLTHGRKDLLRFLLRRKRLQTPGRGHLDVDTEAISNQSDLMEQFLRHARDDLCMNITTETVFVPQKPQRL